MKKIQCLMCDDRFTSLDGLYEHMEEEHDEDIPQDMSIPQYHYFLKTGKTHGNCIVCKNKTDWNEATNKYKRFCNNPKCTAKYREDFKKRMINKYGKTTLLNDPEQQRKMLAHRHISGEYIWSDGTKKTYTGSYELDFLKFLDVFMNFDSDDVFSPSPHTYYYEYNGEKKFYIPDIWIASLNLEIEIKESDNTHPHMQVDREKEQLKDSLMASFKNIDYIKIIDKKYDIFFKYLSNKKEQYILTNSEYKMNRQKLTESYIDEAIETCSNIIKENFKPMKIKYDEPYVIMAKDILDNIIKIVPEELDVEKIKLISQSKECYNDIIKYLRDVNNEYMKKGLYHYYTATMGILSDKIKKNPGISNNELFQDMFPYGTDNETIYEYLNIRINELLKIQKMLSDVLLLNLNLFGINVIESQEKILNSSDTDKIKILKKCINDEKYKNLFIKENKNTVIFDYTTLGGGVVLFSKQLCNEKSFKQFKNIHIPSQYLTRSMMYDIVIVSHHCTNGISEDKWPILPIDVNGVTCHSVYEAIKNIPDYKDKKILVLVCNPKNIRLESINEFLFLNVTYAYIDNIDSDEYSTLFENQSFSSINNTYLIKWNNIINSLIVIKNFIEKNIITNLQSVKMLVNPNEIEYFDSNDIKPHTKNIKSLNQFFHEWDKIFTDIAILYRNIINEERVSFIEYQDYLTKKTINKDKGFILGFSRSIIRNHPAAKLLVLGPRPINEHKYRTIKEALDDLQYMLDNNLLSHYTMSCTNEFEMIKTYGHDQGQHRTFTLENADEVLKDWCNE